MSKIKGLFEIDCNEPLWYECTDNLQNGWGNLENESRFAFQTKNTKISEDDINSALYDVFPDADTIEVSRVYPESKEPRTCYFGVSIIIYQTGISENRVFG